MIKILRATYGPADVTEKLRDKLVNSRLVIKADNSNFGDPTPGVIKYLTVQWTDGEHELTRSWKEGALCAIPDSTTNKLGIFYSNNMMSQTYPTIDLSLETIKKASEGKADILTCVWNRIPTNPFPEFLSWYKVSAHLTQVLQILQLLYIAREMHAYEYVSFLEHDCLYGEGVFDYPDFPKGKVLCNMNYMGLCRTGWQGRGQDDKPFSQVTMHFEDAIAHFESILPNAVVTNSGLVEPQVEMLTWESPVPSIHVNHGFHFTSHFSIYKKNDLIEELPYWGHYRNYSYLFP